MFELYRFSETEITLFALMIIRISCFMAITPIFGVKTIPRSSKLLLCLMITFVLFPVMKQYSVLSVTWKDEIILLAGREAFFGLFLGFLSRLIFLGVEIAGQVLGFTMGFSTVTLVNPAFGDSSSVLEQFETILATLLFLAVNGHHMLLEGIYKSFQIAPLGRLSINPMALASITTTISEIFVMGIKLAGPMIAVILFLNLAMGVVGRMVPQINVFVISFPVNIIVGLFVFIVSIPLLLTTIEGDFFKIGAQVFSYMKGF